MHRNAVSEKTMRWGAFIQTKAGQADTKHWHSAATPLLNRSSRVGLDMVESMSGLRLNGLGCGVSPPDHSSKDCAHKPEPLSC